MHCFICDREDDLITFDKLTQSFSPCTDCQEAITECLEDFEEEDDAILPEWEFRQVGEQRPEPAAKVQSAAPPTRIARYLETGLYPQDVGC